MPTANEKLFEAVLNGNVSEVEQAILEDAEVDTADHFALLTAAEQGFQNIVYLLYDIYRIKGLTVPTNDKIEAMIAARPSPSADMTEVMRCEEEESLAGESALLFTVPRVGTAPLDAKRDREQLQESTTAPLEPTMAKKPKKQRNRCVICRRKIGILGFSCKCSNEKAHFCSTHRYPDAHDCTYDFKSEYQQQLRESLPKVVADKVKARI